MNAFAGPAHRRALRRWGRLAEGAALAEPSRAARLRAEAEALRRTLDRVISAADDRLHLAARTPGLRLPLHTDWAWRPPLWAAAARPMGVVAGARRTPFAEGIAICHDADLAEVVVRQVRNTRSEDVARSGVSVETFGFDGSYLALTVDLPPEGLTGLTEAHLFRLGLTLDAERPTTVYGRLNLRQGPDMVQAVCEFRPGPRDMHADLDMAGTGIGAGRTDAAWLDLILDRPAMTHVVVRDLTLARRPRAPL